MSPKVAVMQDLDADVSGEEQEEKFATPEAGTKKRLKAAESKAASEVQDRLAGGSKGQGEEVEGGTATDEKLLPDCPSVLLAGGASALKDSETEGEMGNLISHAEKAAESGVGSNEGESPQAEGVRERGSYEEKDITPERNKKNKGELGRFTPSLKRARR